MSNENPNTPSSPSCGTRARTLSYGPARACFCRSPTASKQSPTTMEKSSPLTSRSQPLWGRYPILPNPIIRGNAASTNTPTAHSDSTSQKVQISLLCQIPMSKWSRINSTLAPERYSATELLVRFSSTPKLSPLHFAVEWAPTNLLFRRHYNGIADGGGYALTWDFCQRYRTLFSIVPGFIAGPGGVNFCRSASHQSERSRAKRAR